MFFPPDHVMIEFAGLTLPADTARSSRNDTAEEFLMMTDIEMMLRKWVATYSTKSSQVPAVLHPFIITKHDI
jgi:hypothetical protein